MTRILNWLDWACGFDRQWYRALLLALSIPIVLIGIDEGVRYLAPDPQALDASKWMEACIDRDQGRGLIHRNESFNDKLQACKAAILTEY